MRVRMILALVCTHLAFLMHAPAVAEVTAAPFGVDGNNEDEGWGVAGRLTYAANFGASALVHVGGAVVWEETTTTEADAIRYRSRPEAHVTNQRLVDKTGCPAPARTRSTASRLRS